MKAANQRHMDERVNYSPSHVPKKIQFNSQPQVFYYDSHESFKKEDIYQGS